LISTVEAFREQYEFSGVGSKDALTSARAHRRAADRRRIAQHAAPARTSSGCGVAAAGNGSGKGGSQYEQVFSDLELDRYEDINILARVLSEITSDISEVQNQVNSVLDLLSEDSDHFSTNISGLQNEIMRARMVPLDQLFIRLHRPLRDAADREAKEVRLVTIGETSRSTRPSSTSSTRRCCTSCAIACRTAWRRPTCAAIAARTWRAWSRCARARSRARSCSR
jgi:chemotaxis protein histidine kinase CheA